jgi:hypothetical protein
MPTTLYSHDPDAALQHVYVIRPFPFQHVGMINSAGAPAPLRASTMWAGHASVMQGSDAMHR